MDGSEADGDLVLIQTFPLYSVNQVILMLTIIFQDDFLKTKQKSFVSKQGPRQPHIHSKVRVLSPQQFYCKMVDFHYNPWHEHVPEAK